MATLPVGPVLVSRSRCIACNSERLEELSRGRYGDAPLCDFLRADPWGEDPMPHVADATWVFVRCGECGQAFHREVFSDAWNKIRFDRWMSAEAIAAFLAQSPDAGVSPAYEHVRHLLRIQDLYERPRLLDFGCGAGRFLEMARLFGIPCAGVDRAAPRRSSIGFEVAKDLEEVDGDFHVISMMEVLEHLDDPMAMLVALERRLTPDGMFLIEVPDCTGVTDIVDRRTYHLIHPMEHINAFTPESLVKMLARLGFEPAPKKPAFVTMSPVRIAKDVAKATFKERRTQRYFRRSGNGPT